MKTGFQVAWVAILLVGCSAPSKFKNDPRAAVVGPDYLDYIEQYPMDHDTQYYYPHLGLAGAKPLTMPNAGGAAGVPQKVSALMTERPAASPEVLQIESQGWPKLERAGISL